MCPLHHPRDPNFVSLASDLNALSSQDALLSHRLGSCLGYSHWHQGQKRKVKIEPFYLTMRKRSPQTLIWFSPFAGTKLSHRWASSNLMPARQHLFGVLRRKLDFLKYHMLKWLSHKSRRTPPLSSHCTLTFQLWDSDSYNSSEPSGQDSKGINNCNGLKS